MIPLVSRYAIQGGIGIAQEEGLGLAIMYC